MNHTPRWNVSASAVVRRSDGLILATQRDDDGTWVTPGGLIEVGETPAQAVLREVAEETGFLIKVTRLPAIHATTQTVCFVFEAVLREDVEQIEAPQPGEVTAIKWVTLAEARDLLTSEMYIRIYDTLLQAGLPDGPRQRCAEVALAA